jgi:hypothetical protein
VAFRRIITEKVVFAIDRYKLGVARLWVHQQEMAIGTANQTVVLMREGIVQAPTLAERTGG